MKKKETVTLPPVNYPVLVYHMEHARVNPCACDSPEDLERLLRQGWFLSQAAMLEGRPNELNISSGDADADGAASEEEETSTANDDERDELDDMLDEEEAAENSSTSAEAKPKKKKNTKKK